MKVAVIGATGNIEAKIVIELLTRGHAVTGITRYPEQLQPKVKFTAKRGDVNNFPKHRKARCLPAASS